MGKNDINIVQNLLCENVSASLQRSVSLNMKEAKENSKLEEKSILNKNRSPSMKNQEDEKHLKLPDISAHDICSSLTTSTSNVYFSDNSISKA